MMQFLKSILSRDKDKKMEAQKKEIDEITFRLNHLEKRVDVLTEAITELSVGLTNVGTASRMLAQDVSSLTLILETIQTAVTPDGKLKISWYSDNDDADYLN